MNTMSNTSVMDIDDVKDIIRNNNNTTTTETTSQKMGKRKRQALRRAGIKNMNKAMIMQATVNMKMKTKLSRKGLTKTMIKSKLKEKKSKEINMDS